MPHRLAPANVFFFSSSSPLFPKPKRRSRRRHLVCRVGWLLRELNHVSIPKIALLLARRSTRVVHLVVSCFYDSTWENDDDTHRHTEVRNKKAMEERGGFYVLHGLLERKKTGVTFFTRNSYVDTSHTECCTSKQRNLLFVFFPFFSSCFDFDLIFCLLFPMKTSSTIDTITMMHSPITTNCWTGSAVRSGHSTDNPAGICQEQHQSQQTQTAEQFAPCSRPSPHVAAPSHRPWVFDFIVIISHFFIGFQSIALTTWVTPFTIPRHMSPRFSLFGPFDFSIFPPTSTTWWWK